MSKPPSIIPVYLSMGFGFAFLVLAVVLISWSHSGGDVPRWMALGAVGAGGLSSVSILLSIFSYTSKRSRTGF